VPEGNARGKSLGGGSPGGRKGILKAANGRTKARDKLSSPNKGRRGGGGLIKRAWWAKQKWKKIGEGSMSWLTGKKPKKRGEGFVLSEKGEGI